MPDTLHNHGAMRFVVAAFFIAYFLVGLSVYRDYGMSWDEPISRNNGLVASKYVLKASHLHDIVCANGCESDEAEEMGEYRDRAYGVLKPHDAMEALGAAWAKDQLA